GWGARGRVGSRRWRSRSSPVIARERHGRSPKTAAKSPQGLMGGLACLPLAKRRMGAEVVCALGSFALAGLFFSSPSGAPSERLARIQHTMDRHMAGQARGGTGTWRAGTPAGTWRAVPIGQSVTAL